jgi:hypothetical protein
MFLKTEKERREKAEEQCQGTIVFGGIGTGKSTLLNIIVKKFVFTSGFAKKIGVGLTTELKEYADGDGKAYIDPSGITESDPSTRATCAKLWRKALMRNGKYKIVFVCSEKHGRIEEQDKVMMRLVLDAEPSISDKFGIIVNQCGPKVMKLTGEEKQEFLEQLMTGLPTLPPNYIFLPRLPELDDQNNVYEFPTGSHDASLRDFLHSTDPATLTGEPEEIPGQTTLEMIQVLKRDLTEAQKAKVAEIEKNRQNAIELSRQEAMRNTAYGVIVCLSFGLLCAPAVLTVLQIRGFDKVTFYNLPVFGDRDIPLQSYLILYIVLALVYRVYAMKMAWITKPRGDSNFFRVFSKHFHIPLIAVDLTVRHVFIFFQGIDSFMDVSTMITLWKERASIWLCVCWTLTTFVSIGVQVLYLKGNVSMIHAQFLSFGGEDVWQALFGWIQILSVSKHDISMSLAFSAISSFTNVLETFGTLSQFFRFADARTVQQNRDDDYELLPQ